MTATLEHFLQDSMGKRFLDVVKDPRFDFKAMVAFFEDTARQQRMQDAQPHFNLPPLGAVAKEIEQHPAFTFLVTSDRVETRRLRQAIGVLVKVIMEKLGWQKTGHKGSLFSISKYFSYSELYTPPQK